MKKIILILVSSVFLSGCFSELPLCDDSEVHKTLDSIITDNLKELDPSIKFVSANNIKESGFNKDKEIRVCKADIVISNGEETQLIYNIHWQNKKKGMFWVEIPEQ